MSTPPLIVTGMHRSGTSLVASMVAALGVDMGTDLLPADANNPSGYFEDAAFRRFNGRLLEECTRPDDGGHRDWGWTESQELDPQPMIVAREEAAALVGARSGGAGPWGWKDPRTTVLLDFWDAVTGGEARFLFVYRYPWDVADSMQRLAAPVFLDHPEYGHRIWSFYNRRIVDFLRHHRERSALVSVSALVDRPGELTGVLRDRLGVAVRAGAEQVAVDRGRLRTVAGNDPLISLVAATSPDSVSLLRELDDEALISAQGLWSDAGPAAGAAAPAGRDRLAVVVPCRDHGEFLIEAVASVERDAHGCELVIVDDGSRQPRTLEVLEVLRGRGHTILDQPPMGLSAARNRAIAATSCPYVLPLDADNRLRPGFVDAAIRALDEDARVGVVHGDWWEFGMRNGRREVAVHDPETLLWTNTIDACAVFRREVWEQAGGYDPLTSPLEDWDLWISAGLAGWVFRKLEGITFDYRVRPTSLLSLVSRDDVIETILDRMVGKRWAVYDDRFRHKLRVIALFVCGLPRRLEVAEMRAATAEEALAQHQRAAVEAEHATRALAAQLEVAEMRAATAEEALTQHQRAAVEAENATRALAAQLERITSTRGWALLSWYWRLVGRVKGALGVASPR